MSDDALVERGAAFENRRAEIEAELARLQPALMAAAERQKKSALKLGINTGLGIAGIALAPPTFGLSLLVTVGSSVMVVWDAIDMGADYFASRPNRQRLRELRREVSEIADELAAIDLALNTRYSRGTRR
jgi:hypothetical protein